jgi:3-oxoacyl-[acyl-carrier protein] reductase
MRDPEDVSRLARRATAVYGRIDILVNNAGISIPYHPLHEVPFEEWQRVLAINLTGPFLLCQAILPGMLARNRGKIINFASELALIGRDGAAPYVATKAGIIGLTKSLAREVGPKGIQVNAIAPGPTDTGMLGQRDRAPESVQALPLRRLGRPDDIAATALFLASPDGDWYTGQVLSPNGGAVI